MINTIIKGSFSVQVLRGEKEILSLPRTKNLITRGGMDSLAVFGQYLHLGTGGTAPVFADTSLESFLVSSSAQGSFSANTSVLTGTDYLKESQNTFTFDIGAVIGNISELGITTSPTEGADIQTRALFKDGIGDPTTITVTAQDQLVITYFIQKTISMIPFVSSIIADLDGTPTVIDFTIRPCISSIGDAGSSPDFPASILQGLSQNDLYMVANDANRISVDGVTYVPTSIDSGGESSAKGDSIVSLTASGNEVTHTMSFPIGSANFEWRAITISASSSTTFTYVQFQIEFDGPNYINKTASDSITFSIKETVNQVII